MRLIYIMLLLVIISCGESEWDRSSRAELATIFRKTNLIFQDLKNNQQDETSWAPIVIRDFYGNHLKRIRDIRTEVAEGQLSDKFAFLRPQIDSLLRMGTHYLDFRQKCMLNMAKASATMQGFRDARKKAILYRNKPYSRNLAERYYSQALDESMKYKEAKTDFLIAFRGEVELAKHIQSFGDSIISVSRSLNVPGSLSFHRTLTDTSDVLFTAWGDIKDFDMSTDELTRIFRPANANDSRIRETRQARER